MTRKLLLLATAAAALAVFAVQSPNRAAEANVKLPAPAAAPAEAATGPRTVVFAGGCFWGVQGVFQHVKGVQQAVSGYAGGTAETADYETVSSGETGHAESVRVTYDPSQVKFADLLRVYFSVALDPTEVNHQGPDDGPQYRSDVFVSDAEQAKLAKDYIAELDRAHVFAKPIATKVDTGAQFYPAEAYHQDYLTLHPESRYIQINDMPKVSNLKRLFPELYREAPVTTTRTAS